MPETVNPVSIPSFGYSQMAEKWGMIHDLLGGTKAMREAGERWLPKEPGESYTKYMARLGRTILYNGYGDTLWKLSGKPFSHPVTISNLPEELKYLIDDVDSTGRTFEDLAQEVLHNLIKYGVVHIFVDHSVVSPAVDGQKVTKAEEEKQGARVLMSCIPASHLIGWQSVKQNKNTVLTQIRFMYERVEPVGAYGDALSKYIRVVSGNTWELWKSDEKGNWFNIDNGVMTLGQIPIITLYANRTGFMTADPPLEDLAWMNIVHWQSYSDQRNILRLSRFGILFGRGMPKTMTEQKEIEIGPTRCFFSDSEQSDMKYVEIQGNSILLGQKDVEDIELKMEILGGLPMTKQQSRLATSVRIDSDRNSSQLQCWIRNTERGLEDAIKLACEWRKIPAPEELSVDLYSDFETAMLGESDSDFMLRVRQAGEISQETFLKEIRRRGKLADSVDVQEELTRLSNEVRSELEEFIPDAEPGTDE